MAPEFENSCFELPLDAQRDLLQRLGLGDQRMHLSVRRGNLDDIGTGRNSLLLVENSCGFAVSMTGNPSLREICISPVSAAELIEASRWDDSKRPRLQIEFNIESTGGLDYRLFFRATETGGNGRGFKEINFWDVQKRDFKKVGDGFVLIERGVILVPDSLRVFVIPLRSLYLNEPGKSPIVEKLKAQLSPKNDAGTGPSSHT